MLNQRLAKDMYQKVVPVRKLGSAFLINAAEGQIVDYALQMKRMDNSREMHLLLAEGLVTRKDIDKIARILVPFHRKQPSIKEPLDPDSVKEIFNDIRSVQEVISSEMGAAFENIIVDAINFSDQFVDSHLSFKSLVIESFVILWRRFNICVLLKKI